MTTPYESFRAQCASAAEIWDRAAETARSAGDLQLAHLCSDQAIKCGYLAHPEPEIERLFNFAATLHGIESLGGAPFLDETERLMQDYARFLRWVGYLRETAEEQQRMIGEGGPVLSQEHADWLARTYAPPGVDPHSSPILDQRFLRGTSVLRARRRR